MDMAWRPSPRPRVRLDFGRKLPFSADRISFLRWGLSQSVGRASKRRNAKAFRRLVSSTGPRAVHPKFGRNTLVFWNSWSAVIIW